MFAPVGPLPAAVYWRRRWTALIATVVSVGILSLALFALVSSNHSVEAVNDRTAPVAAESALQPSTTSATPTTPPALPAAASPAPAPEASEQIRPDPVATAAASAAAGAAAVPPGMPVAPPPTALACTDRSLVVSVQVDRPVYRVGEKPAFRLIVTNTGSTPCKRDLDLALQEVFVVANPSGTRTWSSNDCTPGHSDDVRVLMPNTPVVFAVTWSGLGSEIGCKTPRKAAPAGTYTVGARLGAVMAKTPVTFTLTMPPPSTG
jgi:hypothetical protein